MSLSLFLDRRDGRPEREIFFFYVTYVGQESSKVGKLFRTEFLNRRGEII